MSGKVVHFEIPFDNAERAKAFYFAAFGWELTSMPGMDYTIVETGPSGDQGPTEPGYINGGLAQRSDTLKGPVVVVEVLYRAGTKPATGAGAACASVTARS